MIVGCATSVIKGAAYGALFGFIVGLGQGIYIAFIGGGYFPLGIMLFPMAVSGFFGGIAGLFYARGKRSN